MLHRLHVFPNLILLLVSLLVQFLLSILVVANPAWRSTGRRTLLVAANLLTSALLVGSYLTTFKRTWRHLPNVWGEWLEASGLVISVSLTGLYLGILVWRAAPRYQPPRRTFMKTLAASLAAAPAVVTAIGAAKRHAIGLSEVNVVIPNLPKDLDGLRLVQVTDIHLSPFFSEKDLARSIDIANETRAHCAGHRRPDLAYRRPAGCLPAAASPFADGSGRAWVPR